MALYRRVDFTYGANTYIGTKTVNLVVVKIGTIGRSYLASIGRLGIDFGPYGGVHAGIIEAESHFRWWRLWYVGRGRGFGLHWSTPRSAQFSDSEGGA